MKNSLFAHSLLFLAITTQTMAMLRLGTPLDSSVEQYLSMRSEYLNSLLLSDLAKKQQRDYPDLASSMNKPKKKCRTKNHAHTLLANPLHINNSAYLVLNANSDSRQVRIADKNLFNFLKNSRAMAHSDNATPSTYYQPWVYYCDYPMYVFWRIVYGKKDYASKQLSNKQRLPKKLHKKAQ